MKHLRALYVAAFAFVSSLALGVVAPAVALAEGSTLGSSSSAAEATFFQQYGVFIIMMVLIVVYFIMSSRSNKKRQKEANEILNSLKPGNKVVTIGRICGTIAEVSDKDNTFVLKTGSEKTGYSYIRFEKEAIYTTDAKPEEKKEDAKEEKAEKAE